MRRNFAGVLGLTALCVVLVRGCLHADAINSVFWSATISMLAFALLGWIAGVVAEQIVVDSVVGRLHNEIEASRPKTTPVGTTTR